MEKVRLGDLVEFSNGYAFKSSDYVDESNTLNCRMSNIRPDGSFDIKYSAKYLPDAFIEKYSDYVLKDGDLIIAMTDMAGDPKILGIPTVVKTEGYNVLMNQRVGKLKLKTNDINPQFLKYSLSSYGTREYFKSFAGGGVQLNIGKKDILNALVSMYDIAQQDKIVFELDKITDLIDNRKKQLEKLYELVKSRFVELFGDRYINDRKWESKPLYECADFYNGKAHEQVVDENGEYILVTSRCIASDITDYRKTNELLFPLQVNDIAMVMSDVPNGRALAKCILIDEDNKYTLNQRICCLRNYTLNPIFFYYLLNRHEYFLSFNDGNAQTNLRKDDLLACNIIVPPLEIQELFASFVEQTDKSKLEVQNSLEKLELLKNALMQKYFG